MTLATGAALVGACAPGGHGGLLSAFEAHLAAHDSATEALRQWCAAQGIAVDPRITAQFIRGRDEPPPEGLRARLAVGADEPLGYRHVRLSCNGTVLSEAHNWYVAARLTPEMNRALAESDTPFGKVAAPLNFTREPLPAPGPQGPACPEGIVTIHRALLRLPGGPPLAMVVECYTAANLAGPKSMAD